jgi:DNA (cytosine-5)-methyltransferase 1
VKAVRNANICLPFNSHEAQPRFDKIAPLTMIDLFCGTGGFAEGFLKSGIPFDLKYALDLDSNSTSTAACNHPTTLVETGDIRHVQTSDVKQRIGLECVDVIIGGPPCQGYSSLRPRRGTGKSDDRNDLYMEFARFVRDLRPKMVVLENVVGLLTHQGGDTLSMILEEFTGLGYRVDWRILNAAAYGVPQKRERFIMLAARDNALFHFPQPTHRFDGKVIGYKDRSRVLRAHAEAPMALSVMDAISDLPPLHRGETALAYTLEPQNEYQAERRKDSVSLSLHKAANHNEKMMRVIELSGPSIRSLPPDLVTSGFSSCYSRLAADEPATTITVKFQSPSSSKCIHPVQNRTLTPREAARIQSFDDAYTFTGPPTDIARQIGNAVPPLLGRALARAVAGAIADAGER